MLSRVVELLGSVSFWVSSLPVRSRAAGRIRPPGSVSAVLPRLLWWPIVGTRPTSDPRGSDSAPCTADRSFVSSGLSGLRLLDNGACPHWEEWDCLSAHQQGGATRGKTEDEVDVSCVQLSASGHVHLRGLRRDGAPCGNWWLFR